MPFVVKVSTRYGLESWIKHQAGPYRIGPREQATVFVNRALARRAIDELPESIRKVATFSIEDV